VRSIAALDLERAGVEVHEGAVRVDKHLRTSSPHVYAASDVTGGFQFTHYAGWQRITLGVWATSYVWSMTFLGRVFAPPSEKAVTNRYRATWNDVVLAESADTVVVEGNQYFPLVDVRQDRLRPSDSHTTCPWKGLASYYDVVVGDKVNRDAAWYYPNPSTAAGRIKGRVAFWHGVKVEEVAR
jgi:uncharacterized protein (DUF427 family)